MKTIAPFFLIAFALFAISCQDDESFLPQETSVYPLEVGNLWIYEVVYKDTLDQITKVLEEQDTVIVQEEQSINGLSYAKLRRDFLGQPQELLLRDSSGYLVDPAGQIYFSKHLNTEILRLDTIGQHDKDGSYLGTMTYRMTGQNHRIEVPAGSFDCWNFQGTYVDLDPDYPYKNRKLNSYFAPRLGWIQTEDYYYSASRKIERRLVAYNIAER